MANPARRAALLVVTCLLAIVLAASAGAAPTGYQLDAKASTVGFSFILAGAAQNGSMPVSKARIIVDPADLAASRVDISLDVAGVRTPLPFARQALIGPEVLDVARHPTIRFVSTGIQLAADGRLSGGAQITGKLTLRGVTRPVTFKASLYRARGSSADDLSRLTVRLQGAVSRSAFGATGFGDLVADRIKLDITAVIHVVK